MKIGFVLPTDLTGVLHATPLLQRIRQNYPHAQLDVWAPEWTHDLFTTLPQSCIHTHWCDEEAGWAMWRQRWALRWHAYDILVRLDGHGYGLHRADQVLRPTAKPETHLATAWADAWPSSLPLKPYVWLPERPKAVAERPVLGVRLGAQTWHQTWPLRYWYDTLQDLQPELLQQQAEVHVFGSPQESALFYALQKSTSWDVPLRDFTHLRNAGDVAQALSHCTVWLGPGSGLACLAATLGIPTIALYSTLNPQAVGPLGPHAHVLQPPVLAARRVTLPTAYDARCLVDIFPAHALSKLRQVWKNTIEV